MSVALSTKTVDTWGWRGGLVVTEDPSLIPSTHVGQLTSTEVTPAHSLTYALTHNLKVKK